MTGATTSIAARPLLLALLIAAAHSAPAHAAVSVIVGPTPIPDGEAAAARDITVMNEKLAFALAVESPVPYGVPRGAIIDVGPVVGGKPARDRVVFADFIPNNWSAWPNTYQQVEIVERGPQRVVVKATRDWGKVTVATTYTLRSSADRIEMQTVMTNGGDAPLAGLLSGQTLWPSAGYFFPVPGLGDLKEGKSTGALADRAVAYDEDWSITLHAPYLDFVGSNSMDLFLQHTLQPGEARVFDAWLQVGPRGDLGPVVAAEIERGRVPAGTLRGSVKARDGKPVREPVVVIAQQGRPYAWSFGHDGRYDVPLPAGDYEIYATGKGYSQGKPVSVKITAGTAMTADFSDVEPPGRVDFSVVDARTAQPLDARIGITAGQRQLVEFLGRNTFFTELERKGRLQASMAPGRYTFTVSSGGGVLGPNHAVTLDVRPGQTATSKVALTRLFDPPASGWYSADLHHHADQAEGVTPPEYLARSQLAAGLDLLFVSDHDSTANHAPLQQIAAARGVPFIPSLELSPSWGHFNAWPLTPSQKLGIDTATASIDDVLGEARRQGAIVVQSNHPFIPYGYLASLGAGLVPGGFNPAFDLAEINADEPYDTEVMQALGLFWSAGHRYYLAGGTDVHDVWNHESGRIRTFGHVDGPLTPASYAQTVKNGRAYVTYGPLIEPAVMFGSELKVKPGVPFPLAFGLQSATGLKQARLIGAGTVAYTQTFSDGPRAARVEFRPTATGHTWYSLEVEDVAGRKAYSNPIWIDAVELPPLPARP
jgi:Carboxypeptidase regulatory-like domain